MRPLALQTVLAAVDLDDPSSVALSTARRLAAAAGASLHVVHVIQPLSAPVGPRPDAGRIGAVLREAGVADDGATVHTLPGDPADTIRALAERIAAHVIVAGPHRRREHGGALGGTVRTIAERAFMPCLIVARPLELPLGRVLVPIDRSDTARGALLVALSWASALRIAGKSEGATTLTALRVEAPDDDAQGTMDNLAEELAELRRDAGAWAGVSIKGETTSGTDAAQAIMAYASERGADLVVVGTRGLGLDEEERLGSVSAALAASLETPLLLVPPAVWRAHEAVR
jgi:nucleotide-binding universal stress UspA family protein